MEQKVMRGGRFEWPGYHRHAGFSTTNPTTRHGYLCQNLRCSLGLGFFVCTSMSVRPDLQGGILLRPANRYWIACRVSKQALLFRAFSSHEDLKCSSQAQTSQSEFARAAPSCSTMRARSHSFSYSPCARSATLKLAPSLASPLRPERSMTD
ncbi:hypothetical protein BD779DRAFT_695951 [Infundibulicybe gibba]|nr:hypothetical protein BD779DRAFT_695951 [Infundibulicybe gibba]